MDLMASRMAEGEVQEHPPIAIIDDDDLTRKSTGRLLSSIGFRSEAFASAEELLQSPRMAETACLLLDVKMPGMGGLELQRLLVMRGFQFPIIFVSANGNKEIEIQALQGGAAAFLHKPVPPEALLAGC